MSREDFEAAADHMGAQIRALEDALRHRGCFVKVSYVIQLVECGDEDDDFVVTWDNGTGGWKIRVVGDDGTARPLVSMSATLRALLAPHLDAFVRLVVERSEESAENLLRAAELYRGFAKWVSSREDTEGKKAKPRRTS